MYLIVICSSITLCIFLGYADSYGVLLSNVNLCISSFILKCKCFKHSHTYLWLLRILYFSNQNTSWLKTAPVGQIFLKSRIYSSYSLGFRSAIGVLLGFSIYFSSFWGTRVPRGLSSSFCTLHCMVEGSCFCVLLLVVS